MKLPSFRDNAACAARVLLRFVEVSAAALFSGGDKQTLSKPRSTSLFYA
jgi:hypothetical protein